MVARCWIVKVGFLMAAMHIATMASVLLGGKYTVMLINAVNNVSQTLYDFSRFIDRFFMIWQKT